MPRVPRDPQYAGQIGAYLGGVLPVYAENFMDWWKTRLRPEIERNFAHLDGYDYEGASLLELAVLLEDAIDIHDRHWKIHWMLNFAQFASTQNLNAVIEEVGADPPSSGRLQSSVEDRNWDGIEDLWRAKEEVKSDPELRAAFEQVTAAEVMTGCGAASAAAGSPPSASRPTRRPSGTRPCGPTSSCTSSGWRTPRRSSRRSVGTWPPTTTFRPTSRPWRMTCRPPSRRSWKA